MNVTVLVLRILLIVVCCETAIRYGLWWRSVHADRAAGILPLLMLGIALVQGGTFLRHFNLFHNHLEDLPLMDLVVMPDAMILAGTIIHLVPCWRISNAFSDRRIALEIVLRGIGAALIAAAIMFFNFLR